MITTATMNAFARLTTPSPTTYSRIMSTTKTMTTSSSMSPTGTTKTATGSNKHSVISIMLRTQLRTMTRKSSVLNSRKNLKKRWELRTTQNLCMERLKLRFQAEKKLNHNHILTLLLMSHFHSLQVYGEQLIHVPLLTDGHNLLVVLIHNPNT
jgi:hypothetical protein